MNFGKLLRTIVRVAKIVVKAAPSIAVAVGAVKRAVKGTKPDTPA